jgi:hypothetical protein
MHAIGAALRGPGALALVGALGHSACGVSADSAERSARTVSSRTTQLTHWYLKPAATRAPGPPPT